MSTQVNGQPKNVINNLPTGAPIQSSTNTNPIVVTTFAPHGMADQDYVEISAHEVNLAANGTWPATVLGASSFSIPTAGVGVGAATGVAYQRGFGTTFPIPSDGVDDEDAASVGPAFESEADRSAYLLLTTGIKRIVSFGGNSVADSSPGAGAFITAITMGGPGLYGVWALAGPSSPWAALNVQIGDTIDFRITGSYKTAGVITDTVTMGMTASEVAPGAVFVLSGHVRGTSLEIDPSNTTRNFSISGQYTVVATAGSVHFDLDAAHAGSGGTGLAIDIVCELNLSVVVYRQNQGILL